MPDWRVWLECVADAVCTRGRAALNGQIPFAAIIGDISNDAWERLRNRVQDGPAAYSAAASADSAEFAAAVPSVVETAVSLGPPEREALARYLRQVPAAARATLRRPSDPEGLTAPASWSPRAGQPLVPNGTPRFNPGDRPIPGRPLELEFHLGTGGFGEVWAARDTSVPTSSLVALKFCKELDSAFKAGLAEHESRIARLAGHEARLAGLAAKVAQGPDEDGVVALRNAHLGLDPVCLEYDYVPGGDLTRLVDEWHRADGPWPQVLATEVVMRLARVVGRLHRSVPAIIHRDLKPSNILVRRRPDGGFALKIADFGISLIAAGHALALEKAGLTWPGETVAASLRGACTFMYASQQQKDAAEPTPRDDVHALGVIWFQLLIGRVDQGIHSDIESELTSLQYAPELIQLLRRCLAWNPAERPTDAADLAERIEELLRPATELKLWQTVAPDRASVSRELPAVGTPTISGEELDAILRQVRSLVELGDEDGAIATARRAQAAVGRPSVAGDVLADLLVRRAARRLRNEAFEPAVSDAEEAKRVSPHHPKVEDMSARAERAMWQSRAAIREMRFYLLALDELTTVPGLGESSALPARPDDLARRTCPLSLANALADLDAGRPPLWRVHAWRTKDGWKPLPPMTPLGPGLWGWLFGRRPAPHVLCAAALVHLARREEGQAEGLFWDAARADPSCRVAHHGFGLIQGAKGMSNSAHKSLDRAFALAGDSHTEVRVKRAMRYLD